MNMKSLLGAAAMATLTTSTAFATTFTPVIWETNFGSVVSDASDNDDYQEKLNLSFLFPFASVSYGSVWMGSNGGLQLDDGSDQAGNDDDIGYEVWADFDEFNDDGTPTIFPFNTDLDPEDGGVGTAYFNDFGNRAVFTWDGFATNETDDVALVTFQVQLFDTGTIVFGYDGMFAGPGQSALNDLDVGILVGISNSDGTDNGGSDLSNGPFSTSSTTIYELWCYDSVDSCDGGRPGPLNSAFDLDQTNVIFTPNSGGGFDVSNTAAPAQVSAVPLPAGGLFLLSGLVGVAALKRRKNRAA